MTRWNLMPAIALAIGLWLPAMPRAEDTPNLQELERRLDAAKREQAAQAEAARRKATAEASRATLVVRSDAECALSVNGAAQGVLAPNATRSLEVTPGQQLVECVSSELPAAQAAETASVEAGKQAVVVLQLGAAVDAARQAGAAAKQREADQRACAGKAPCMVQAGAGILRQPSTGLEWTQADNGRDINWNDATRWCESRGEGWRLPDRDELYAIYDKSGAVKTKCARIEGSATCAVSPLFKLTGWWYWSSSAANSSEAWGVGLADGFRFSLAVSFASYARALCVRRS